MIGRVPFAPSALVAALLLVTPAHAARLGAASAPDIDLVRIFAGFVFCALLAVAAAGLMHRARGGATKADLARVFDPRNWPKPHPAEIAILETHRLSIHGDICRVRTASKEFVLVVGPGGTTILKSAERAANGADAP